MLTCANRRSSVRPQQLPPHYKMPVTKNKIKVFFLKSDVMLKTFFVALLLSPLWSLAQQIKLNEVDGFTGKRHIETSIVSLQAAYTNGMGISLSTVGDHYLVNIVGYGKGIGAIRKQDFVYFLMEDGLIITATSIGNQPENEGGLTRVFQHHYLVRMKDLVDLSIKKTRVLRLTTLAGNLDITVNKKNAKDISKLGTILIKEIKKTAPAQQ